MLFPLAYILGDVLTEIYGYKYTRRYSSGYRYAGIYFNWLAV